MSTTDNPNSILREKIKSNIYAHGMAFQKSVERNGGKMPRPDTVDVICDFVTDRILEDIEKYYPQTVKQST